jgi:hypothetical protein
MKVQNLFDACTISNFPIKKRSENQGYFEIKIEELGRRSLRYWWRKYTVSIGVSSKVYPKFRLCGWNNHSVGFHSDNGYIYHNDAVSSGKEYSTSYGKGDIIGCGIRGDEVFFTKNGKHLGVAQKGFSNIKNVFANVGCDGYCKVTYNFGNKPFKYQPEP